MSDLTPQQEQAAIECAKLWCRLNENVVDLNDASDSLRLARALLSLHGRLQRVEGISQRERDLIRHQRNDALDELKAEQETSAGWLKRSTEARAELAALRAVMQQAVMDVEKMPHSITCNRFNCTCSICGVQDAVHPDFLAIQDDKLIYTGACEGFVWINGPCNCGHDAAIANLKKGLGGGNDEYKTVGTIS